MILPKDIKTDSVESVVCEAMLNKTNVEMDEDTTKMMMAFLMDVNSRKSVEDMFKEHPIFQAKVIMKRMKVQFDRVMDPRAAILITMWAQSVGSCVMYMYYCQYMCIKRNVHGEFTMDNLIDFFPNGFISDDDMHGIWRSQKVDYKDTKAFDGLEVEPGGDNLVDYGYASGSLIKETVTA